MRLLATALFCLSLVACDLHAEEPVDTEFTADDTTVGTCTCTYYQNGQDGGTHTYRLTRAECHARQDYDGLFGYLCGWRAD